MTRLGMGKSTQMGSGHPSVCTTSDFHAVLFLKILRRSEVTINLTRRLKKMGASEFAPL